MLARVSGTATGCQYAIPNGTTPAPNLPSNAQATGNSSTPGTTAPAGQPPEARCATMPSRRTRSTEAASLKGPSGSVAKPAGRGPMIVTESARANPVSRRATGSTSRPAFPARTGSSAARPIPPVAHPRVRSALGAAAAAIPNPSAASGIHPMHGVCLAAPRQRPGRRAPVAAHRRVRAPAPAAAYPTGRTNPATCRRGQP